LKHQRLSIHVALVPCFPLQVLITLRFIVGFSLQSGLVSAAYYYLAIYFIILNH